ncbi:MAG: HlyC/CorC family transporter [Proteobacteria bacterium]|nr:HlyC/CorC family transporter [Pseudomonadota bacterium]
MINLLWVCLGLALVLLNAFFVAAEFGMVKLRHTRIEEIKNVYGLRSKILIQIHQHLDSYLSACQLGITLASLGLGWVGEPAFARLLEPLFQIAGIQSREMIQFLSFFVAFSFLSFLHIVVGELMPKSMAIRQSERVSLWTALPLYGFYWIMYPAIWLLNTCSNFLLKLFKLDQTHQREQTYSTEEIKLILHTSLHGDLTQEEAEILEHTLDLGDLKVTEVMRPIDEMTALEENHPIEESLQIILKTRYSRYPLYQKSPENITGIIHIKDVLAVFLQNQSINSLTPIIRPILKVNEHLPALELLRKFREGMPHFAVVSNDANIPVGFITLDNLLHILFGRIKDEFHKTKDDWIPLADGSFLMNGNCSLYAVEQALDIDIEPEPERVTTLAGLILKKIKKMPRAGEQIEFDQFTVIIDKIELRRILKVRVYKKRLSPN